MDLDMDPDLSGFWKAKIRIWQGNDMYKQYKYFFIIPHSPSLTFTVYVTGIDLPLAPAVSVHPCFDFDLYAIWHIRVVGFVFFFVQMHGRPQKTVLHFQSMHLSSSINTYRLQYCEIPLNSDFKTRIRKNPWLTVQLWVSTETKIWRIQSGRQNSFYFCILKT